MLKIALLIAAQAASPPSADNQPAAPISIYSNEEQVYFAKETGEPVPPLFYVRVEAPTGGYRDPAISGIDAFGGAASLPTGLGEDIVTALRGKKPGINEGLLTASGPGGALIHFRRARPATCWVAVKKDKPKPDGSPDWHFQQGVKLHDQGGRALVGKDAADTQPVVIRMRNVTWQGTPGGRTLTNKPSIVLYVHKPDQPDRAESYVWADPGAARIGINLRWMQASCGIDGAEAPS